MSSFSDCGQAATLPEARELLQQALTWEKVTAPRRQAERDSPFKPWRYTKPYYCLDCCQRFDLLPRKSAQAVRCPVCESTGWYFGHEPRVVWRSAEPEPM